MATEKPKSIIYVDGFNFYYGVIRQTPHKWLDLEKFFTLLRPDDDIVAIKYFTAMVAGPTKVNQETYIRALGTSERIKIIFGRFKSKKLKCRQSQCTHAGERIFETQEEKRTDVNIAVHMLNDAHHGACDKLILVSGDSDLVPALVMIKDLYPEKKVWVYVPARDAIRGAAVELRSFADQHRRLPLNFLDRAHFPSKITRGAGAVIEKPANW